MKQRATLGFLLLQANRVVATSHLMNALWSMDDAPSSARKILQNAVWGLRRILTVDTAGSVALVTKSPGYELQVPPDQVDLHLFNRMTTEATAKLGAGAPDEAARLLRDALALWKGPVLADLVEAGIDWPELTRIDNARLNAMEDSFDAELACGRHRTALEELEAFVAREPTRERSHRQLMLALYRCGRQTDALGVYSRLRTLLAEELGLEPGPELRALEHAILIHDPSLAWEPPASRITVPVVAMTPPSTEPEAAPAAPDSPVAVAYEHRHISIVVVRVQLRAGLDRAEPKVVDQILEAVGSTFRREVTARDGVVAGCLGSLMIALFGVPETHAQDPERAVWAALALRDRLIGSAGPATGPAPGTEGLAVHTAVATGEALVRCSTADDEWPPAVNGTLLDHCQALLAAVPPGEVRVCDATKDATGQVFSFWQDGLGTWRVADTRQAYPTDGRAVPFVDRERELEVLTGLVERVRHRGRPHMATVLGSPGIGKTRLVMELTHRAAGGPFRFVVCRFSPSGIGAEVVADVVSSCLPPGPASPVDRLAGTVQKLATCPEEVDSLVGCLGPLVDEPECRLEPSQLDALRILLERSAHRDPLALIIEDIHHADDALLDFVEQLAESVTAAPLLVVTTATTELLARRPGWAGGQRHSATLTLDPLSEEAIDLLVEYRLSIFDPRLRQLILDPSAPGQPGRVAVRQYVAQAS